MYELGQIWIADESLMNVGADKLYFADVGSAHLRSETRKMIESLELAEIGLSKIKTPCFVKVIEILDLHSNRQRS